MNPMALAGAAIAGVSWMGAALNSKDLGREVDVNYLFLVMVDFAPIGEFSGVEGISRAVDTEELQEGGRTYGPHVRLKHGKAGGVTLKWGMMDRSYMWDWMETVQVGMDFRREVTIVLFNRSYIPVRVFYMHSCFPTLVKASSLDGAGSTSAIDELALVYDRLIPVIIPQDGEAAVANLASTAAGL